MDICVLVKFIIEKCTSFILFVESFFKTVPVLGQYERAYLGGMGSLREYRTGVCIWRKGIGCGHTTAKAISGVDFLHNINSILFAISDFRLDSFELRARGVSSYGALPPSSVAVDALSQLSLYLSRHPMGAFLLPSAFTANDEWL